MSYSSSFRAAHLLKHDIHAQRPVDIPVRDWNKMKQRVLAHEAYLSYLTGLVFRTQRGSSVADGLAVGCSDDVLHQNGFTDTEIGKTKSVWKRYGSPVFSATEASEAYATQKTGSSSLDPIFAAIKEAMQNREQFLEDVMAWIRNTVGPDTQSELISTLDSFTVPEYHFAIHRDTRTGQPLEVSMGFTVQEKAK